MTTLSQSSDLRQLFVRWLTLLLTKEQVARMFDREQQTIDLWRRERGLPAVVRPAAEGGKNVVLFDKREVLAWARENGVEVVRSRV